MSVFLSKLEIPWGQGLCLFGLSIISLAPSTINIYYPTNCPNIHTSVKKQIQKPLKGIFLTHVSLFPTTEFHCNESVGWQREGIRKGQRQRLPSSKRQETQVLAIAVFSDLWGIPRACNFLFTFRFIFSPNSLGAGQVCVVGVVSNEIQKRASVGMATRTLCIIITVNFRKNTLQNFWKMDVMILYLCYLHLILTWKLHEGRGSVLSHCWIHHA